MKKLLSVILCLCMIMTTIGAIAPTSVMAATVYDGSTTGLSIVNNDIDADGEDSLILTTNVAGFAGKDASDVVYQITPNDTDDPKFDSAYLNPYSKSEGKSYVVSYDMLLTSGMQMSWELWTFDDSAYSAKSSNYIYISAESGLTSKSSAITFPGNAPTSLTTNQWHNIAIEIVGDGTAALNVYIDGVKYASTLPKAAYGVYCLRSHYSGNTVYLDNYSYDAGATYDAASYEMDITVEDNAKVTYDADAQQFTLVDSTLTAGELKELIGSDYDIAVYKDASYKVELADTDTVTMACTVVAYNGDKSYRYYDFYRANDSIFTYSANADGVSCTVTGYETVPEASSALAIPETIAGYTVTAIGTNAFRVGTGYSGVKLGAVTMPDTVKTIGNSAFKDTGASVPAWPADLESIGDYAFSSGGTISSVFPEGLKSIGSNVFNFSSLGKGTAYGNGVLNLPEGLESIGELAFLWCGSVTEVIIPDTVTSIGLNAFQTSYGIKSIRLPENETLTEIPQLFNSSYPNRNDRLFVDMSIYIPETITTIPTDLLKHFKDGANVTIYGVKDSAAYDYYLMVKEALEAGTYTNAAVYPETGSNYTNPEDADGDGKGELASISFVEYDFDIKYDSSDINTGTKTVSLGTVTNNSVLTANVAGLGGKTADDVVLKLDTMGGSGGQNFIGSSGEGPNKSGVFYHEISVMAPSAGAIGVQFGTYNTTDLKDDPDGDGVKDGYYNLNPDAFKVTNNAIYAMGTKVMDAVAGRWYTIATEIACDGTKTAAVYVNGVKFDVELDEPAYGIRHFRVYPHTNSETYQVYYDNIRAYRSTTREYNQRDDKAATVTSNSDAIEIYDEGIVYADPEAIYTAQELKGMLVTDDATKANVRIYEDATYTTELVDTDFVTNSSVVVVAARNGYDIERVFSYYPVNPPINTTIYDIEIIDEDAKTAKVTGFYEKNITETDDLSGVNIPETIMGYTITEIGAEAFYKNTEIQTVTLPDTVTKIGDEAFGSWAEKNEAGNNTAQGNIISVKLPKNLKEIGAYAFAYNNSLKAIELPAGLETIGHDAFYWTGIKELSIPDSVTSIGANAFRLTSIGYLKLSGGITEYTSAQFSGANTKITELVIPASVTNIGANTFRDLGTDADGNKTVDNTANMGDVVVYGVSGTYAEEYAEKYGFEFVNVVANTIVTDAGIYGDGTKELAGTDFDIRYGYESLDFKANLINIGNSDVELTAAISLSDANGNIVASAAKDVTVAANDTLVIDETSGISIPVQTIADGYKASVTLTNKADSAAVIDPIEFTFSSALREIHVLHIANSFGNDSFGFINKIAEADGITLKVQNMYIGGAKVTQHYKNISKNLAEYQPVINGDYQSEKITVQEALTSDKWDVVALQAATHGSGSDDYAFIDYATWADDEKGSTTGTANITSEGIYTYIRDYVETYAPRATKIMHMSWGPCEAESEELYGGRFAEAESARSAVFEAQKAAYEYASSIYAEEEGMMVPTSIAVQYALNELGYLEHSGEQGEKETYPNPVAGDISIYRDETCHLTTGSSPYGRVLAGLTWYEYLTGNDVRENPYQQSGISAEVMADLKEAAHYANTQVVPITGSESEVVEAKISVNVVNGKATVKVDGEDKGDALNVATYPVGTALVYTAAPVDENQEFLYWYDVTSKAILSTDEIIEVTVGSDAEYRAIYADKEKEIYVTFKSNNKIIAIGTKDTVTVPSNPYIAGYSFAGWYNNAGKPVEAVCDVEENTVYTAGFKLISIAYPITIIGANEQSSEYKYNEKVTVSAAGEEGKVFTHWTRNGKVVSYSETYSFYVDGAATVTANYADTAAEKQVVLVMATPTVVGDNADKIAFYAERNVPDTYTVIETGILLSQANAFDATTEGVIKAKATSTANVGQYTIRKANVKTGETWNAKAYLIYSDGENTYTVYSDMVTKTLN